MFRAAKMFWHVCEKLFHKLWIPVKDLQSASFGSAYSEYSRPTEKKQCLVTKHTSNRCTRVTDVCKAIVAEMS